MTTVEEASLSNAMIRRTLIAAEEIIGKDDLNAVLYSAGLSRIVNIIPPDDLNPGITQADYARLNEAIEYRYGRGGKGVLQRIGGQMFKNTLKSQSALLNLAGSTMRLLPKYQRVRFVLTSISNALQSTNSSAEAEVDEQDGKIAYVERSCAVCRGRKSDKPICHIHVGELGAAIIWAVGEGYEIRETSCMAMGDEACRFDVLEHPAK